MALTIIKAGILDSLQDGGRYGHASTGINPGGVMDSFASTTANCLVGNSTEEAVIELHFPAAQILFKDDSLISICGADFSPAIDGEPIPNWQPVMVKRNGLLHFQKWHWGSRAYLAVHGGFKQHKWLNSYSTHLKAGAGGYHGRALAKDDMLEVNCRRLNLCKLVPDKEYLHVLHWGVPHQNIYEHADHLLILPGPEWDLLDNSSKELITNSTFTIAPKSDRMGYLLNGRALQLLQPFEMISSGVDFGTIQLLAGGQLMILMADHQTTGGYPRIGNVIGVHLHKLAQLRPGAELRFSIIDINTAEQLLFSQLRDLRIIERSCLDHLNQLYAQH
jgi:antagonist of KipI